jgi:hypothetical protein
VSKIINLKFKRAFKKSVFGKIYAGGGSRDRFESGGLLNMFKDTLQLSLIAVGNNLNKTGFSSSDLSQLGGFNRSGQDGIYNGTAAIGGSTYGGIEKILSSGFNLNNDYGKKLKMNLIYFYSNSNVQRINSSLGKQFLSADTLISANTYQANTITNTHNATGLIRWKPDTTTTISYTPKLSFTAERNEADGTAFRSNALSPLTESYNSVGNNTTRTQFQHSFNYYHSLKKKRESISITQTLNINPDQTTNLNYLNLISSTPAIASQTLDRLTDNQNRSTSAGLEVNYRYPLSKKITGNIGVSGRYQYNARGLLTYDKNLATGAYSTYLDDQSTTLTATNGPKAEKPALLIR